MVKRIVKLPALTGVAANQTATLDIPIGPRYHVIWLSGQNANATQIASSIGECRLKVNGKVQRVFTATELDDLNKLNGSIYGVQDNGSATPGSVFELPIFLAEPWRKSLASQDGLAWGTGDLSTFQLEVDIKATPPAYLYAIAEVDNSIVRDSQGAPRQQGIGAIVKWFRTQIPTPGLITDIPNAFPRRDFYQQISFFSDKITKCVVKVDNFVIREISKPENDAILKSRGMVPVSGRYDLVFDHDDLLNSALPMSHNGQAVQDFQVQLVLSSVPNPATISTIYQQIGPAE